jgi:RNA polymerase sigma-70 factor (ECF subfamily)
VEDDQQSDDQLFRDYLGGREAAFAELVRRHERTVRAVARRYVARPEDVLDLAQRAFLRAIEAGRRGRWVRLGRVPPFGPLLIRTVVNLAKNQARDAARWRQAPLEAVDGGRASAPDGTAALEREEQSRALRAAVVQLPRRQREVLTLRIDAELPFAAVARTLGITENAAKVHFHHATRRLAALVAVAEEP